MRDTISGAKETLAARQETANDAAAESKRLVASVDTSVGIAETARKNSVIASSGALDWPAASDIASAGAGNAIANGE